MAHIALAAVRFKEFIKIFRAVVVCKLFPRFDILDCIYAHFTAGYARFAIGSAGVVDVAGSVMPLLSVDCPFRVDIEQVASTATIGFCVGYFFTYVFDDKCPLGYGGCRKKTKSRSRVGAFYDERFLRNGWFLGHGFERKWNNAVYDIASGNAMQWIRWIWYT